MTRIRTLIMQLAATLLLLAPAALSEILTGTTLVAVKFGHGVVVAADSRTSMGTYVSNRHAAKISVVKNAVIMRSGSAADTQHLAWQAQQFVARRYSRGHTISVSALAHYCKSLVYDDQSMQASLIVAGYEESDNKPVIYIVAPNGSLLEQERFGVSGSGSTFIYGYLDNELSREALPSREEAIEICRKAVQLAIDRDGSSGGPINIVVIDEDGTKHVVGDDNVKKSSDVQARTLPGFASPIRPSK